MKRIKITLPPEVEAEMREEAKTLGLTLSALIRMLCCETHGNTLDARWKGYIMRLENWREAEAFVRAQGRKSVGDLADLALDGYLRKNHLSAAQKAAVERSYGK